MMVLANDWRQQRRTLTPDGASAEPIMSDGKTPRSLNWEVDHERAEKPDAPVTFDMDQCRRTEKV
jgi:hypothetical protein